MALDFVARASAAAALNEATLARSVVDPRITIVAGIENLRERAVDPQSAVVLAGGGFGAGSGSAASARTYVSDSRATQALATAFPRFCQASADGRYFRLVPDDEGLIPVSACGVIGTDVPDHTVNHQPGIQAALDYALAIGANGVRFDKRHYSIWCPLRTPTSNGEDITTDHTGHPIMIYGRQELRAAPGGTTFWRRTREGKDPAVFANTQPINPLGKVGSSGELRGETRGGRWWRGGMFFLKGVKTRPASYDQLATLILSGEWRIFGGIPKSNSTGLVGEFDYYELNPDGSGWDILDKGVWAENDRHTGDFIVNGTCHIDGFRGELTYHGGQGNGSIYVNGTLKLSNTDGDAWNFQPFWSRDSDRGEIQIDTLIIERARQAFEGAVGYGQSRIRTLIVRDCDLCYGIEPGHWASPPTFRDYTPSLTIDLANIERSGEFWALRWTHINKMVLTDTALRIGTPVFNAYGCRIGEVTVRADRNNMYSAVLITSKSATPGSRGTYDCSIGRLICERSPNAVANNRAITFPLVWSQSLGPNLQVSEVLGQTISPPEAVGTPPDFQVSFETLNASTTNFTVVNVETGSSTLTLKGPYYGVHSSGATGLWPVRLPAARDKVSRGARIHLFNDGTAPLRILRDNSRLDRSMLLPGGSHARFEWDGNFWFPLTAHHVLRGAVTATLQKAGAAVPPGDLSDEVTFTVNGARAGMLVRVVSSSAVPRAADVRARVSADNTVAISVRNGSSTEPLQLTSIPFEVVLETTS